MWLTCVGIVEYMLFLTTNFLFLPHPLQNEQGDSTRDTLGLPPRHTLLGTPANKQTNIRRLDVGATPNKTPAVRSGNAAASGMFCYDIGAAFGHLWHRFVAFPFCCQGPTPSTLPRTASKHNTSHCTSLGAMYERIAALPRQLLYPVCMTTSVAVAVCGMLLLLTCVHFTPA